MRAGFPVKLNRRGQPEDSCRFQENTEKEGASATAEINADLNFDRSDIPDSTPIIQCRNDGVNKDEVNPIKTAHTSRDFGLHGDVLHEEPSLEATSDSLVYQNNNPSGLFSKSPNNNSLIVKPGLVRDTTAKLVRITQPISSYEDGSCNTQLGKRHTEASFSEHPLAKRLTQKDEVPQSTSFPTVEAAQQPRRTQ